MGIGNIATTGMQASMTDMEVISNNIANANTPGFKSSFASFSDLFPSGNDASSTQAGLGVQVSGIQQNFSTGGPAASSSQTDIAIKNNGFFMMRDATTGGTTYTRNGHFMPSFSSSGGQTYLTNSNGQRLQGFLSTDGSTIPAGAVPTDLLIDTSPQPAVATTILNQQGLNLNASDNTTLVTPFSPTNATTYNYSNTSVLYDSLGNTNTLSLYYVKTAANNWDVNVYVNGSSVGSGALVFDGSGNLTSSTGLSGLSFSPTSGATSPQSFDVNMAGASQYGGSYSSNAFSDPTGHSAGIFDHLTIDGDGKVTAVFKNSQKVVAGQIALATFLSPGGLQNAGNVSWTATAASGSPNVTQASSTGGFIASSLEMSNVDLAAQMVSLINAQNNFQANAQVEQVYNQVMQTVTKMG